MMKLLIEIGSKETNAGLFEGDQLIESKTITSPENLIEWIRGKNIEKCLMTEEAQDLIKGLLAQKIPCQFLKVSEFHRLATPETLSLLKPDRIANIFGALHYFPSNDCIVVDLGMTIRFDYVTKQGVYLGGAIFPATSIDGSSPILSNTVAEQEKSGNYFGLLGAIERIVAELRLSSETPSTVMSIATGGLSRVMQKDLEDFIDKIDPELTLVGLNQILKEGQHDNS